MPLWSDFNFFLMSPWTWVHFGLGAIVGSFLNVCIIRIPKKIFWRYPRSVCPNCESPIPFYFNIPIISFLVLRGKAACCHVKLSWQYPIVELMTAILFCAVYYKFPYLGESLNNVKVDEPDLIRFYHLAIFSSLMIVCAVIDFHHMIIPDVISLPMIILTPVVVYYHPELNLKSAALGILVGGGILYGIAWIYWLVRKEIGLGFGDVKLLAAIGGWLGVQAVLPTILIGSILGTLIGVSALLINRNYSMRTALPFGPFLAFGAVAHMFYNFNLFN
jgi:leader peptidase (prepilin peptidase) / N-methyltransferase